MDQRTKVYIGIGAAFALALLLLLAVVLAPPRGEPSTPAKKLPPAKAHQSSAS